jgi:RNA processing factor Prp31
VRLRYPLLNVNIWAISSVMREIIPLIEILDEIKENINVIGDIIPEVRCKVFEDINGAVEVATSAKHPKMRPRKMYINNKYHHFRKSALSGKVKILPVSAKEMLADILTKNCNEKTLNMLRPQIMG